MSSETTNPKSGRKAKTLDEEIAAQREKLRKLEERQREQQRKEREADAFALCALIPRDWILRRTVDELIGDEGFEAEMVADRTELYRLYGV